MEVYQFPQLGDPKDREMTFINMTTRCGSTLLSCMLARVPRVRVMSEPWSFVHSHGLLIQVSQETNSEGKNCLENYLENCLENCLEFPYTRKMWKS